MQQVYCNRSPLSFLSVYLSLPPFSLFDRDDGGAWTQLFSVHTCGASNLNRGKNQSGAGKGVTTNQKPGRESRDLTDWLVSKTTVVHTGFQSQ